MTQTELAEKLLCGQDLVSLWERGLRPVTDTKVLLICERFGVSEKWLRTGEGKMYDKVTKQLGIKNEEIERIMDKVLTLDTDKLLQLECVIDSIMNMINQ